MAKVKDDGITPTYFLTLKEACNGAASLGTIKAWSTHLTENLTCGLAKSVILKGGYNTDFSVNSGYSTLHGILTIGSGSLEVERLVIN